MSRRDTQDQLEQRALKTLMSLLLKSPGSTGIQVALVCVLTSNDETDHNRKLISRGISAMSLPHVVHADVLMLPDCYIARGIWVE
eukprot:2682710-Amphidinium_carterae.1